MGKQFTHVLEGTSRFMFTREDGYVFGSRERDDPMMEKVIQELDDIICASNTGEFFNETIKRVKKLPEIGSVTSLSFFSLAVHLGFLCTQHSLRQSLQCQLDKQNPFWKYLVDQLECDKDHIQSALKRLAKLRGEETMDTENLGCKAFRREAKFDFFVEGQWIFHRWALQVDGEKIVKTFRRKLEGGAWEEYQPKLPPRQ